MSEQSGTGKCMCMGAGPALTQVMENLGPSEAVRSHFKAARVEFLKGLRAMIDSKIQDLSKPEQKGSTIPVE
ncbi:MAG: hypothetical protein ABI693_31900 [Bryobacteraceae bacterium]